jgi:hypothetical protein
VTGDGDLCGRGQRCHHTEHGHDGRCALAAVLAVQPEQRDREQPQGDRRVDDELAHLLVVVDLLGHLAAGVQPSLQLLPAPGGHRHGREADSGAGDDQREVGAAPGRSHRHRDQPDRCQRHQHHDHMHDQRVHRQTQDGVEHASRSSPQVSTVPPARQ